MPVKDETAIMNMPQSFEAWPIVRTAKVLAIGETPPISAKLDVDRIPGIIPSTDNSVTNVRVCYCNLVLWRCVLAAGQGKEQADDKNKAPEALLKPRAREINRR
jgi:hypothetical protein